MAKSLKELAKLIGEEKRTETHYQGDGSYCRVSDSSENYPRRRNNHLASHRRHFTVDYTSKTQTASRKLQKVVASNGSYDEVVQLLARGADPRLSDHMGRTPLHFAACRGDTNVVQLLITYGASVNNRDKIGNTPLHLACCSNHIAVVTALLSAGTDVLCTDFKGKTPLHLALSRLRMLSKVDEDDKEDKGTLHTKLKSRKSLLVKIVEMLQEYLSASPNPTSITPPKGLGEVDELELLAEKLSLSDTGEQVNEVEGLLRSFTEMSINKRKPEPS